jgi:hypothetical protein
VANGDGSIDPSGRRRQEVFFNELVLVGIANDKGPNLKLEGQSFSIMKTKQNQKIEPGYPLWYSRP